MNAITEMPIICSLVANENRLDILPSYTGKHFLLVENQIYKAMSEYCADYSGGYWIMWELSNGGFYMAPGDQKSSYSMSCVGNYFDGSMSGDAAGIVSCLVAFSRMAWHTREDRFTELFYALRDWAGEHPEAGKIFAAID